MRPRGLEMAVGAQIVGETAALDIGYRRTLRVV